METFTQMVVINFNNKKVIRHNFYFTRINNVQVTSLLRNLQRNKKIAVTLKREIYKLVPIYNLYCLNRNLSMSGKKYLFYFNVCALFCKGKRIPNFIFEIINSYKTFLDDCKVKTNTRTLLFDFRRIIPYLSTVIM